MAVVFKGCVSNLNMIRHDPEEGVTPNTEDGTGPDEQQWAEELRWRETAAPPHNSSVWACHWYASVSQSRGVRFGSAPSSMGRCSLPWHTALRDVMGQQLGELLFNIVTPIPSLPGSPSVSTHTYFPSQHLHEGLWCDAVGEAQLNTSTFDCVTQTCDRLSTFYSDSQEDFTRIVWASSEEAFQRNIFQQSTWLSTGP